MAHSTSSPVLFEARKWSELPDILQKYESLIDEKEGGVSRIFGYASLVTNHKNEKPEASSMLANEKATVRGMEVAMNMLAAGEFEFRGTRGEYRNTEGKATPFANVGVYAGLEPATSADGYAQGMNITTVPENRRESLIAYIKRELGEPPAGLALTDLFDKQAANKFARLKGTKADDFGMYKFQIAQAEIETEKNARTVPVITVSTNEQSRFAAIGHSPMQTAHLILDGQGYSRKMGETYIGGAALDYFKNSVIGVARNLGFHQPRLEAIDHAVETLAEIEAKTHAIVQQKLPYKEEAQAIAELMNQHPEAKKITSFHFQPGQNVNPRAPVSDEDKALPQNQMPHTAEEKFARIERLRQEGKTNRTPSL